MKKDMTVAIIYDFDGTLADSNMQESSFIPSLGMDKDEFWDMTTDRARSKNMDRMLAYMTLMIDKAQEKGQKITVDYLKKHGESNDERLFPGLKTWFSHLDEIISNLCPGVMVQHFIISAGIKEMIEGSCIAKNFDYIFASSFMYDADGTAKYPAVAVNYTGKTQFLYRINKGVNDIFNDEDVNRYVDKDKRPIPFEHMIYIGDGSTDIPAMKLVSDKGGFAIGVYAHDKTETERMFRQKRVDYFCKADYSKDRDLFEMVTLRIRRLYYEWRIQRKIKDNIDGEK